MLPSSFSVENYRAFAGKQDIAIRPLTMFFGWNSGGKSALIRFLPLLAESVRVAGPPIWLGGEVGRGATWPELVCKATERDVLRFGLTWARGEPLAAEWEVAGDLAGRWQEVRSLSSSTDGSRLTFNGLDAPEKESWTGLLPRAGSNAPPGGVHTGALRSHLAELSSGVQWISGLRARPPRLATYGGGAPPTLRPDGLDAVDHLIAAKLRSADDPLLEATRKFFSAMGEHLDVDSPMEGAWRLMLQPTGAPRVRVNLSDTGEGYAQVLPVLVALARTGLGGPGLVCLEQPELHLHTRAQAELARLLVEFATASAAPSILVETHSEVLLTSVQLAIANEAIPAKDVIVYWVESRPNGTSDVVPIEFDAGGRPKGSALIGAFDEAIRLGQELILKQMPRGNA